MDRWQLLMLMMVYAIFRRVTNLTPLNWVAIDREKELNDEVEEFIIDDRKRRNSK